MSYAVIVTERSAVLCRSEIVREKRFARPSPSRGNVISSSTCRTTFEFVVMFKNNNNNDGDDCEDALCLYVRALRVRNPFEDALLVSDDKKKKPVAPGWLDASVFIVGSKNFTCSRSQHVCMLVCMSRVYEKENNNNTNFVRHPSRGRG